MKKIEREPTTADKDGEEEDNDIESFYVEVAQNGFVLTVSYEDGTELKTVHLDFDEVLDAMRSMY